MGNIGKLKRKIGVEIQAGFWYTVGNFLLKGIVFITLPILTRLMTPSDFGLVSLYTTWVAVFTIFVGLCLQSSIIRGYNDFKKDKENYFSSVLFLSLISFITVSFVIVLFRNYISDALGFSFPIIILILLQSYFTFIIEFYNLKYIAQYLYKKSLFISLSNTIVGTLLAIALVMTSTENKYMGYIYGMMIPSFIIGCIILIRGLYTGKKLIYKYWNYALKLSLPIIPHLLFGLILAQAYRVMIDRYIGNEAVGIYSLAFNLGLISSVILTSLNNAWVPWFYKKMDENDRTTIEKASKLYQYLFVLITIAIILITPELVIVMAPADYREAAWIVPIIVVSYYFQFLYTLQVNIQFYLKKNIFIPIGTIIAGLISIGLNFYYIPIYGYSAAAYITLVSYILLFLMHFSVVKYLLKSSVYKFSFFIQPSVLVLASTILYYFVSDLWILRYTILLAIAVYLLNRYKKSILSYLK